jgi:hypothetical protein
MDDRAYYELYKGHREPKTDDEYEYIIKKLYRQLKKAYTVEEAKAIIEEIYKYKGQKAEMELNKWH